MVFNNGKGAQIVVINNSAAIMQWWGTVVIEAASQPSSPTFAYDAPTSWRRQGDLTYEDACCSLSIFQHIHLFPARRKV